MSSLPRSPASRLRVFFAPSEGAARPRLRPAVRERGRDGADLLLGQGHHHGGPGLRQARPPRRDRPLDLRGRPPHHVPARPLPVRARERLAPVPLELSPLATPSTTRSRSRSATWRSRRATTRCRPMGRGRAGDLRADGAPPAGRVHPADRAADARSRPSATSGSSRAAPAATDARASRARSRSGRRRSRATCCPSRRSRTCTTRSRASRSSATGGCASRWTRRPSSARSSARWSRRSSATTRSTRPCSRTRSRSRRRPSTPPSPALPRVRAATRAVPPTSSTRELAGRVSRLVDWKANNEEILASAVREILGVPRAALSDDDAIRMVLDPSQQPHRSARR